MFHGFEDCGLSKLIFVLVCAAVIIERINLAESNVATEISIEFSFMGCVDKRTVLLFLSLRRTFLQLFTKTGSGTGLLAWSLWPGRRNVAT